MKSKEIEKLALTLAINKLWEIAERDNAYSNSPEYKAEEAAYQAEKAAEKSAFEKASKVTSSVRHPTKRRVWVN